MNGVSQMDYTVLDRPEVLMSLFHPRPEWAGPVSTTKAKDMLIPVEDNVVVGARFHLVDKTAPNILFFHGNGEIVSDYDDFGSVYNRMGINFLPADYRGYGRSTGKPTVSAMVKDCHTILDFVTDWLRQNGYSGPLIVMGRSLGSASALELAAKHKGRISGLIVESGFAYAQPLLKLLGIDVNALGFKEEEGFRNIDKIRLFDGPILIIHAEHDRIIPFSDAQVLYDNAPASGKMLVKIPDAGHNDLFSSGLTTYMAAIKAYADKLR
jgi:pimeloyl-ACP methyl ester carboxylesterase